VIDCVIPEPMGGAHRNPQETAANVKEAVSGYLKKLLKQDRKSLLDSRYEKFRKIGRVLEEKK
ncbi:MAG: acetyl-CoA carboxylase carboxyl transferase subunit alpha, partial [Candidatus Omnitrophica bacterium]|nr:acetyl-CoA carboxylase carboxyl transferase subunit alpha [Candidatus Omnitrophota bacterium]